MEKEQECSLNAKPQAALFCPASFNEVKEIAEQLNRKTLIVLNLESCDAALAERILDFLRGAVFIISGAVKPAAGSVFLLIPPGVDLTDELSAAAARLYSPPQPKVKQCCNRYDKRQD